MTRVDQVLQGVCESISGNAEAINSLPDLRSITFLISIDERTGAVRRVLFRTESASPVAPRLRQPVDLREPRR